MDKVQELNKFLKGIHMGADAFKKYYAEAKSEEVKQALGNILDSYKKHEEAVTHRIEELNGDAADTTGVFGAMGGMWEDLKLTMANGDSDLLEIAIKAINMGKENAVKFVSEHKDLESSVTDELTAIISDYNRHIRMLEEIKIKL